VRLLVTKALELIKQSEFVWDLTLPWVEQYWDINTLKRYKDSGYTFVSLTIQDIPTSYDGVLSQIRKFQNLCIPHSDWLCYARTTEEIIKGQQSGKLVLGLNIQDTELIHDDLSKLEHLKSIGVRHMLLAYQERNKAADGCAEPADGGLSLFGKNLVKEMNKQGMIVDVSHVGRQSSLDAISVSDSPVIFSHSGVLSLCKHIRNIDDIQIKACAETGGVVGVVGIGAFLGDPKAKAQTMFEHIDYIAQLVGPEHIGIGTDFIEDLEWTWQSIAHAKEGGWRDPYGTQLYEGVAFAPEQLVELVQIMLDNGYSQDAIKGVLGANFHRIYTQVT